MLVHRIKKDQNIASQLLQNDTDDNPEIVKMMILNDRGEDDEGFCASIKKCWVNYFSTFYVIWEIMHIVAILAGL